MNALPRRPQRRSPDPPPGSPYVGPQPFQKGHGKLFFGRDREIADIISLLSSRRAVLLHADSGAGKTSLLNAGLLSTAPPDEFVILPPARVRGRPADGRNQDVAAAGQESATNGNTYCHNYVEDLHAQIADSFPEHREALSRIQPGESLAAYADAVESVLLGENDRRTVVYIFDQFEELFTTNLTAWKERRGFFEQARKLLNPPATDNGSRHKEQTQRRLLLSMRSDFVAQVERFSYMLPERLNARYHLQRLKLRQAVEAVARPAAAAGRPFDKGAPEELARRLSEERVMTPDGTTEIIEGEFVEPVQLQVICERLWRSLPADADRITRELAEQYGDVEQGLTEYYELAVTDAVRETRVSEKQVRRWFNSKLITSGGFRSQAFVDVGREVVDGLPLRTADRLESAYHIVRSERRAGARWIEISHDRFVEPIRKSNQEFNSLRQQKLNHRTIAASFAAFVLVAATIIYTESDQVKVSALQREVTNVREFANRVEEFGSKIFVALGSGSLRDRAQSALEALAMQENVQSVGAAYTVLADLHQIRRILTPPSQMSTSRSALAVTPDGELLVGEWREGTWRGRGDTMVSYSGKIGVASDPLSWSRDGTLLAGLDNSGSPLVVNGADGGESRMDYGGGRISALAFDSTGRYLAGLHCPDAGKGTCTSTHEAMVWEVDSGKQMQRYEVPAMGDPRRVAVAWPEGVEAPWLAVSICVPRQVEPQKAPDTSGGDTAATATRSPQQSVASAREASQPICDEFIIRARGPEVSTSKNDGASAVPETRDDAVLRVWSRIDLRGEFSEIAFSIEPGAVNEASAVLYFIERRRDPAASRLHKVETSTSALVAAQSYPKTLITTLGGVRNFLQLDARRIAWIDSEEGIVIADTGQGAPLSTVVLQIDIEEAHETLDLDWGGISRPAFVRAAGEFLYRDARGYLLRNRQGNTRQLFSAPRRNDPVDNVILSSDGRYAFIYGVAGGSSRQDRALYDLTEGRLLATTMSEDALPASAPWAALLGESDRAAYAFLPGKSVLASITEEGAYSTWDLKTGEVTRTGRIALPEDVSIGEQYDFLILRSAPLGVLVGEDGALAVDLERLTAISLGTGINVAVASFDEDSRFAIGSQNGVAIWDTHEVLNILRTPISPRPPPTRVMDSASDIVVDLAVDTARRELLGALYNGAIQLWELDSGRRIGKPVAIGHSDLIGLAFDPVARRALAGHAETNNAAMITVDLSTAGLKTALCRVIVDSLPSDAAPAEICPSSPGAP